MGLIHGNKGSEPLVRPFRPTAPDLADFTVQLALNLRLEGPVAQRRARLARGSNITRDIDVSKRGDNVGCIFINLSVIILENAIESDPIDSPIVG